MTGFAVLHACSSDDAQPGRGSATGGDAGDGGAPPGGSDGTGGSVRGGSAGSANGGTGMGGGAGGGGDGGQSGEPAGGSSGESSGESGAGGEGGTGAAGPGSDCAECVDGAAEQLRQDCADSPLCVAWMTCMRGCSDAACLDACDDEHPRVAPYRYALYGALCDACATECSTLELCDRTCTDDVNLPILTDAPATLAETGLYAAGAASADEVAAYALPFQPEYELWSDGALKQRWAYIPKCGRIGTEGMNHWLFPVGTRLWKEFSVPTQGTMAARVETRLLHRFGPDDTQWLYATYQWPANDTNSSPAGAVLVETGVANANGTTHDIPPVTACPTCHASLVEKALGFSAIQLSHSLPGVTIQSLADEGWLTHPRTPLAPGELARDGWDPPGGDVAQRALGYLHANCGNCHHTATMHGASGNTPAARMRLMVGNTTVESTDAFTTLVDVPTTRPYFAGCDRIEPSRADLSELVMRMNRRDGQQMPPLATEVVHADGVSALSAWIDALSASSSVPTCVPPG